MENKSASNRQIHEHITTISSFWANARSLGELGDALNKTVEHLHYSVDPDVRTRLMIEIGTLPSSHVLGQNRTFPFKHVAGTHEAMIKTKIRTAWKSYVASHGV